MAFTKFRARLHEATIWRMFLALIWCACFTTNLIGCTTAPVRDEQEITVPERQELTAPEKPALEPKEMAGNASNVTDFTRLVYAEETIEQAKITPDKIIITVIPQSLEAARKEAQSFYAAYCETKNGQMIAGLPVSRVPENLPAHIKPPYSQRFKTKYDLPPSVQWCQDKEDVYFGLEMSERSEGVDLPELTVIIFTESFVEKNKVWTSPKDMIPKIEKEIEKDKQRILYSRGVIDIPTIMLMAKVSRPDAEGRQHLELSIENRGMTTIQIRTDADRKFVARDGKSYNFLWEVDKNGEAIKATSSGEGCQLTKRGTLFLVNPGAKCTLSAPIILAGMSQQPPDGMLTLDLFTFDMLRVSAYEDKTSPLTRSPR